MRAIVDDNLKFVARTLRRAGVRQPELDDAIQRTFITVAGRLADVHLGAERSFLFHVAIHVAAHARRIWRAAAKSALTSCLTRFRSPRRPSSSRNARRSGSSSTTL